MWAAKRTSCFPHSFYMTFFLGIMIITVYLIPRFVLLKFDNVTSIVCHFKFLVFPDQVRVMYFEPSFSVFRFEVTTVMTDWGSSHPSPFEQINRGDEVCWSVLTIHDGRFERVSRLVTKPTRSSSSEKYTYQALFRYIPQQFSRQAWIFFFFFNSFSKLLVFLFSYFHLWDKIAEFTMKVIVISSIGLRQTMQQSIDRYYFPRILLFYIYRRASLVNWTHADCDHQSSGSKRWKDEGFFVLFCEMRCGDYIETVVKSELISSRDEWNKKCLLGMPISVVVLIEVSRWVPVERRSTSIHIHFLVFKHRPPLLSGIYARISPLKYIPAFAYKKRGHD